jgi:hypothetical protein
MTSRKAGEAQARHGKHAAPVHDQRRSGDIGESRRTAGADIIEVIGESAKFRGKVTLDVARKKKGKGRG